MATHLGSALIGLALVGAPQRAAAQCGDGTAAVSEECDDGNALSGDGCSATCQLENASALCAGVATSSGTALTATRVASGLSQPVQVTAPPLDPLRLFIVEKTGAVRILRGGSVLAVPFLNLAGRVSTGPEQGLLSIAFHPNFETNRRLFVSYTDSRGFSVLARYEASLANPDTVLASSERVLMLVPQPFANHNGGQLAFGPDGRLYFGLGDGGGSNDPSDNAQNNTSLLGKILRINVDVETTPFYAVPPDNPNPAAGPQLGLIWAKGTRNPWRFGFDRFNGDLYIGDVGEGQREEVDVLPPGSSGANLGWDVYEGSLCYEPAPLFPSCPAPTAGFTFPVHEYDHTQGCSITGGFVYRGCALPDLDGTYFYGDYCTAFVRSFVLSGGAAVDHADHTAELAPGGGLSIDTISSFGEDARGELYVVDQGGEVFKIVAGSAPPTATPTWTPTPTDSPSPEPTETATPSATASWTETPAATDTPEDTATPVPTDTPEPTATDPPATATATAVDTATPPPAATDTPEPTATFIESTPTAIVAPPTNTKPPKTPARTATPTRTTKPTRTSTPTATPTAPPGSTPEICVVADIDGDGTVGVDDLAAVARALLTQPGDRRWNPAADINGNGWVDPIDLLIVTVGLLDPDCR